MTAHVANGSGASDSSFEGVDSKLTIYALANGMDLEKEVTSRRLAWFREGLDRAILIEAGADGSLVVSAVAWKSGEESSARQMRVEEGIAARDLAARLSEVLSRALEAANGL